MSEHTDGNEGTEGSASEDILTIPGVRERMAAYKDSVAKSKVVEKTTKVPVFKVEEGLMHESFGAGSGGMLHDDEMDLHDHSHGSGSGSGVGDLRPGGFFGGSGSDLGFFEDLKPTGYFGEEAEELGFSTGMTYEEAQRVVFSARDRFKALINKFEPKFEEDDEREVSDARVEMSEEFGRMQEQYIEAVEKLRPTTLEADKYAGEQAFENLKQDYEKEGEKKEAFADMQDRWHDLDGAQQDNRWYEWCVTAQDLPDLPTRGGLESENEHQIDEKEEEIASQWIDFTNMVVETAEKIKAESDDDMSVDEDMVKWREEARRLKADAAKRKKRKEAMLERRNKRQEAAVQRHEEFLFKAKEANSRRREQEGSRRDSTRENSRRREEHEIRRKAESDDESSDDGDVEDEVAVKPVENKRAEDKEDDSVSSASESEDEESETTGAALDPTKIAETKKEDKKEKEEKKKKRRSVVKKDKKDKSKKKEKKGKEEKGKDVDVKATSTKAAIPGKPCGDDDDLTDGAIEKNPRNLDGSLWKNPMKFWTNKPKKLNEVGAKYILKTLPRSDCFRRTEKSGNDNASFYWFKAEGDFDVIVRIKGNFRSSYDKAGIMLREDDKNWVLSGLEFFNGELNHSTCITRGVSDWSLSPVPEEAKDGLWICVKRIEGKVECYFSLDVRKWVQTRQGLFSNSHTLKVGIAAACPMGEPFKVVFEKFRVKKSSL